MTDKPLQETTLEDVDGAPHGARLDNYVNQFGGYSDGTPERNRRRGEVYDLAWMAATSEMLDEIHAMLRHLCQESRNG